MRIGLQIPSFTWPGGPAEIGSRLAEIVNTADEVGFYSIWVMDHFFQIRGVGPETDPMLEAYTTLGYIAAHTKRARLGAMITGVIYRYPGLLAKTATTLDILSGGRAYLGIGAAWNESESKALGVPFPSTSERFERLEEALQIVHQMWSDNDGPIHGKHYQLESTMNSPQPLSKPHPPIMVGGSGEKKTLRMVAQYADACNLFTYEGPEKISQKLDILKEHCAKLGRDYNEIERTGLWTVNLSSDGMTVAQVIEMCSSLAKVGIQHLIVNMPNVSEIVAWQAPMTQIIQEVASL
ncbi:MAG: LLM class F420-dependent oxidoreductase [Chloroflexota bacterium]